MTPKETVTVPADVVVDLRTALYAQIGVIAEVLDSLTLRPDRERHPRRYQQPLQDLDRIRLLLDAIGWHHTGRPVSVELDLYEFGRALRGALQMMLDEAIDHPACGNAPPSTEEALRKRARAIRALLRSIRPRERA